MAGTRKGGLQAAKTVRKLYGRNHYRDIGRLGGSRGHTGGFHGNRELASEMGKIGGRISKRCKSVI